MSDKQAKKSREDREKEKREQEAKQQQQSSATETKSEKAAEEKRPGIHQQLLVYTKREAATLRIGPDKTFVAHVLKAAGTEIEHDLIQVLMEDFSYLGFDPYAVVDAMKKIESDEEKMLADIYVIITFGITRGTKAGKAMNRMSDSGKSTLNAVVRKYSIQESTRSLGPSALSIGRVLATFPHVTALIMKQSQMVRIIGELPSGLPAWLAFPNAPAIIPRDGYAGVINLWKAWNDNFSKVIGGTQTIEERAAFFEVIHSSKLFDERTRRELMVKLRVGPEGEE